MAARKRGGGKIRRAAAAAAALLLLAACKQPAAPETPFAAPGHALQDEAAPRAEAAPLPGPDAAAPHPADPAIRLLSAPGDAAAAGWVETGPDGPALPFFLDPGPLDHGSLDGGPLDADRGKGGSAVIPILFLGGDRKGWSAAAMTPLWRIQAREAARRAGLSGPILTLGRPWAGDPSRWRTDAELSALARGLAVLGRAYGFGRVDALGHSSGAHLAVGLAQETGRIRLLAAAAPPLDLAAWHMETAGSMSARVRRQYDPLAHVAGFRADAAALVADPFDRVTPPAAWQGWLRAARAFGKPATLVLARGGGEDRHGLILPAAEALAALRRDAAAD
ncbi:hypothetical protein ACQ5SO_16740 [Rhodovulum sp. DZ06]|uniref:hypothetical protein n=1 Tax=Rhodovulum sp. DZ06 TaxID=3425126 RepID=UPI003D35917B